MASRVMEVARGCLYHSLADSRGASSNKDIVNSKEIWEIFLKYQESKLAFWSLIGYHGPLVIFHEEAL